MSRHDQLLNVFKHLTGATLRDRMRARRAAVLARAAREQAARHHEARQALISMGATMQLPTVSRGRPRDAPLLTRGQQARTSPGSDR